VFNDLPVLAQALEIRSSRNFPRSPGQQPLTSVTKWLLSLLFAKEQRSNFASWCRFRTRSCDPHSDQIAPKPNL